MRNPFRKKIPLPKKLIWGIVEGPFHISEVEDPEEEDMEWMMVLKMSVGDEVKEVEVWLPTYEQVYHLKNYFDKNIEPLELEEK